MNIFRCQIRARSNSSKSQFSGVLPAGDPALFSFEERRTLPHAQAGRLETGMIGARWRKLPAGLPLRGRPERDKFLSAVGPRGPAPPKASRSPGEPVAG
jgi:hypothetical protein